MPPITKRCSACGEVRPLSEFHKHPNTRDGHAAWCKVCKRPPVRKWKREARRRENLRNKYGITPEDYEALLQAQDGKCAICGKECITGRRLAVDHDHLTGQVRGLLCMNCNAGVGKLGDDPERLRAAIAYLESAA